MLATPTFLHFYLQGHGLMDTTGQCVVGPSVRSDTIGGIMKIVAGLGECEMR